MLLEVKNTSTHTIVNLTTVVKQPIKIFTKGKKNGLQAIQESSADQFGQYGKKHQYLVREFCGQGPSLEYLS